MQVGAKSLHWGFAIFNNFQGGAQLCPSSKLMSQVCHACWHKLRTWYSWAIVASATRDNRWDPENVTCIRGQVWTTSSFTLTVVCCLRACTSCVWSPAGAECVPGTAAWKGDGNPLRIWSQGVWGEKAPWDVTGARWSTKGTPDQATARRLGEAPPGWDNNAGRCEGIFYNFRRRYSQLESV